MTTVTTRPMIVVSGSLGSGKTSGLPQVVARAGFARPHVLINDAGLPIAEVSSTTLPQRATSSMLSDGCACCDKSDELLSRLEMLIEEPADAFDALVLEVSGLADASAIMKIVTEHPKLTHHLRVDQLIHYVDAVDPHAIHDPVQQRSLALADTCVVSKSDLAADGIVEGLIEEARSVNPMLDVFAQHVEDDRVRLDRAAKGLPRTTGYALPEADGLGHERPTVVNLELPAGISWLALTTWMIALLDTWGDRILRVKAAIPHDGRIVVVHGVQHTVFPPQAIEPPPGDLVPGSADTTGTIVFIGHEFDPALVIRSLRTFVDPRVREHDPQSG